MLSVTGERGIRGLVDQFRRVPPCREPGFPISEREAWPHWISGTLPAGSAAAAHGTRLAITGGMKTAAVVTTALVLGIEGTLAWAQSETRSFPSFADEGLPI